MTETKQQQPMNYKLLTVDQNIANLAIGLKNNILHARKDEAEKY